MPSIEQIINIVSTTPSDINEHILTLKHYGEQCSHITELGVRAPVSLWAFVASKPKILHAYDIMHPDDCKPDEVGNLTLSDIYNKCEELNIDFTFHLNDVLKVEIEETDLLFIDTQHNYNQLTKELAMHADKAKKYIIFHDTVTWGTIGESYIRTDETLKGLVPAIDEFLEKNPHWKRKQVFTNNNGLTILERI